MLNFLSFDQNITEIYPDNSSYSRQQIAARNNQHLTFKNWYLHLMMFFHQISPSLLTLYTARLLEHTPKSDKLLFYHRSIQTNGEYYDVYKKWKFRNC